MHSQKYALLTGGLSMRLDRRSLLLAGFGSLAISPAWAEPQTAAQTRAALRTRFAKFTGDFDAMLERRFVRMLVPYSQTFFSKTKDRSMALRPTRRSYSSNGSTGPSSLGPGR
jgi:hypothetical protein